MKRFHLSDDNSFSVLISIQMLGIPGEVTMSHAVCERIASSISAYLAETEGCVDPAELARELRFLTRLVLAVDPSIGLIRRHVSDLSDGAVHQIQERALRLFSQVSDFSAVGLDLRGWAKSANSGDLVLVLRLCLVEGGAMAPGRRRPNGRQSAAHFEPVVLGRGLGVSLPKLKGGRPADDAEVRLIAHLAVDWLVSTGVKPERGRDGHSAFSGLVYDVFGWIGIENKAQHCLRQYWNLTKVKRPMRW